MQKVVKPRSCCAGIDAIAGSSGDDAVVVGEDRPHAADELELADVAPRSSTPLAERSRSASVG